MWLRKDNGQDRYKWTFYSNLSNDVNNNKKTQKQLQSGSALISQLYRRLRLSSQFLKYMESVIGIVMSFILHL